MENITEIVREILSTQMLAPSIGELADTLGYRGRSTLYRIFNGNASGRALTGFLQRLEEKLHIGEKSLYNICNTISNTYKFTQIIRNCIGAPDDELCFAVLNSFVTHNFDIFPEEFIESDLNLIKQFERTEPEDFYNMLAYFYVRHTIKDFYKKGLTHRERCAGVMETLGKRFVDEFPENGLAVNAVYVYSRSNIFDCESPILWSLIQSVAVMLMAFSRPLESLRLDSDTSFLPGLGRRAYWSCRDRDTVALTLARPNINGSSGSYEVFRIDKPTGKVEKICMITILSDEILSIFNASTCASHLGGYFWDGETLSFYWQKEDDDRTTLGNTWTKLDLKCSQSLRLLDKSLSDEQLYTAMLEKDGSSAIKGYKVKDILISRESTKLLLENGSIYSINNSYAPFLSQISPSDTVVILRRDADGVVFVYWPALYHCLPLSFFDRETPE